MLWHDSFEQNEQVSILFFTGIGQLHIIFLNYNNHKYYVSINISYTELFKTNHDLKILLLINAFYFFLICKPCFSERVLKQTCNSTYSRNGRKFTITFLYTYVMDFFKDCIQYSPNSVFKCKPALFVLHQKLATQMLYLEFPPLSYLQQKVNLTYK